MKELISITAIIVGLLFLLAEAPSLADMVILKLIGFALMFGGAKLFERTETYKKLK